MHSSGIRTARLLTVYQHALGRGRGCVYPSMHWAGVGVTVCIPACTGQGWGISALEDVCPGGCLARGCLLGGVCPGRVSARGLSGQGVSAQEMSVQGGVRLEVSQTFPQDQRQTFEMPPHRQKDTCENLTFAHFVCGR